MGPNGHKVAERVAKEEREACEKVTSMVGKAFGSQLKELWVGDWRRFDLVQDEKGAFKGYVRNEQAESREMIIGYPNV